MSDVDYIVVLPVDLAAAGWTLIERAPDRLFAVSERWGGTVESAAIEDVIDNARHMMRYIKWRIEQEDR